MDLKVWDIIGKDSPLISGMATEDTWDPTTNSSYHTKSKKRKYYNAVRGPRSSAQGPSSSAQGPSSSAQGPSTAAQGRRFSNYGSSSSAQGPSSSAQGPSSSAQGPSSSAQGPSTAAQGPRFSNYGSSSSAQGPSSSAQGPSSSAQGPSTAAQGPRFSNYGSSSSAQGPSSSAQGPSTAAQGPSTAAQGPPFSNYGPSSSAQGPSSSVQGPSTAAQGPRFSNYGPTSCDNNGFNQYSQGPRTIRPYNYYPQYPPVYDASASCGYGGTTFQDPRWNSAPKTHVSSANADPCTGSLYGHSQPLPVGGPNAAAVVDPPSTFIDRCSNVESVATPPSTFVDRGPNVAPGSIFPPTRPTIQPLYDQTTKFPASSSINTPSVCRPTTTLPCHSTSITSASVPSVTSAICDIMTTLEYGTPIFCAPNTVLEPNRATTSRPDGLNTPSIYAPTITSPGSDQNSSPEYGPPNTVPLRTSVAATISPPVTTMPAPCSAPASSVNTLVTSVPLPSTVDVLTTTSSTGFNLSRGPCISLHTNNSNDNGCSELNADPLLSLKRRYLQVLIYNAELEAYSREQSLKLARHSSVPVPLYKSALELPHPLSESVPPSKHNPSVDPVSPAASLPTQSGYSPARENVPAYCHSAPTSFDMYSFGAFPEVILDSLNLVL